MILDRSKFSFEKLEKEFNGIIDTIEDSYSKNMALNSLPENTALIIIDMINGFAKGGNLYSKNMENLIPTIKATAQKFKEKNMPIISYKDCHPRDSLEFIAYPEHCVIDTKESELVNELKIVDSIIEIPKNSTNAFLAYNPYELLKEKFGEEKEFTNYIVVGGCTDICIYQFALTLKTFFNEKNKNSRVIVPINMVDTFDAEGHNSDVVNLFFLNSMISNGIEVVKTID